MKLFFLVLSTASLVCGAPSLQSVRAHHESAGGYQYNPPAGGYQYNAPAGGAAGIDVPVVAGGSSHGAASAGSHGAVSAGSHRAVSGGSHGSVSAGSHGTSSTHHSSSSVSSSSHSASSSSARASAPAVVVAILRDDRVDPDETGAYNFGFETEDGHIREEVGQAGAAGAVVQTGSYSYTLPDGTPFELKYIADENGFQPESSFLPALPDFVLEQIAFAASEAAAGVTHTGGAVQRQESTGHGGSVAVSAGHGGSVGVSAGHGGSVGVSAGHGGSVAVSSGTGHASVAPSAPSAGYLAPAPSRPSNAYLTPQ